MRDPFDPPYYADDIDQMDVLHWLVGVYDWWMQSESRALLLTKERPIRKD